MIPPMRRLLAVLVLLGCSGGLHAADTVELRWRFTKGQVLKYLIKHREVRTVALTDQKFVTTTDTEFEWEWTVKEVDDQGTASIEKKLTALRVTSTGKDYDFQYDSSRGNDSGDDYKKKLIHFYDQLRFTTYRMKLKSDGSVAEVHGFDKLQSEISNNLVAGAFNVLDFDALNLHDDSFAWHLQQLLGVLPAGAVAREAKWNRPVQLKLANMGEVTGRNDYTLGPAAKVGDLACQQVKCQGEQGLDLNMKWLGNNVLIGTLKTSKLAGKVHFDAAGGKAVSGELAVELAGEVKLGAGDKSPALKISFQHALELQMKP